jgi:hypothetical protein
MLKTEDNVVLFKEQFGNFLFFAFADKRELHYCKCKFDILNLDFSKMNDEEKDMFIGKIIKDNMYDKVTLLDTNSLNNIFSDESKKKYREFKINKIID